MFSYNVCLKNVGINLNKNIFKIKPAHHLPLRSKIKFINYDVTIHTQFLSALVRVTFASKIERVNFIF